MKPILFSPELVVAICKGQKTQTRRVVKKQPTYGVWSHGCDYSGSLSPFMEMHSNGGCTCNPINSPYGYSGDLMWVRERFRYEHQDHCKGGNCGLPECIYYYAHMDREIANTLKWSPSIHMPKWASRIWLEITNLTIQRVQEITEQEAIREGMVNVPVGTATYSNRQSFQVLWDKINKKRGYSWESNPWVWVIDFKLVD